MSPFKKLDLLFMFVLCIVLSHTLTAQVILTHNVGEIVPSTQFSCSPSYMGRIFTLQDFGIAEDEELIINSAEIAYQIKVERELGAWVTFYVYAIDDNFPTSFFQATLLGKSQLVQLETSPTNNGLTPLKTLTADFNIPVTVPPNTKRILVEVEEKLTPNSLYLASTEDETDSSWFRGGCPPYTHNTTDNYGYPDAHFYLKVFGNNRIPSGCTDYPINYTATICDPDGDGIGQFDSTNWGSNVGGFGNEVSYFYANGDPLPDPLPNPYTNKTPYREVITVRVTNPNTGNCHESERTLITHAPIDIEQPPNLYACDEGNGYAHFDVSAIEAQIIGTQTGLNPSYLNISYMDANGQELSGFPSASYRNQQPHTQTVYVQVAYDAPYTPPCPAETSFDLIVRPRPQAGSLNDLVVQDNDGDGFAEFDTSGVENTVVGSQSGMDVSYFDAQGSPLPYPLPNPYTNTTPHLETITVRVSDPITGCYSETPLTLRASNTPIVLQPSDKYACDEGNGFAHFDVSSIESQVIGTQTGLNVSYLDAQGQVLQNFPSASYRNQNPYSQTVTISVTDQSDPTFHVETAFDLIVNPMPVAHALPDLIVCDDDGFAEFDTSEVVGVVVGSQTGMEVSYFDAQGLTLPNPLPDPYTNTVPYQETITVRVTDPLSNCYAETPLTLRVSDTPTVGNPSNLYACDEGNGFAQFDVSSIETQIIGTQTGLNVSYLDTQGQALQGFPSISYRNQEPYSQTITVRVENSNNPDCYLETSFDLVVNPLPQVQPLEDLIVQDEDGDGFAEFDTSGIESSVLGSQTGMEVSYFDAQGLPLPSPLPNPYTNANPHQETITVRVSDPITDCYTETSLTLRVLKVPNVGSPTDFYACDEGNGFAYFDVSSIESQIIGTQTGLNVSYLDANGTVLQNFPSASYRNREPYSQTVTVSVTDQSDPAFHAETAFDLIVSPLPVVHALPDLIVCDDDGITEFDTSEVEGAVVGNQTGLEVSYLDAQGSQLPYPLPNPYINSEPYLETITVVITNPLTGCSVETPLTLRTFEAPDIQPLPNLYACDAGDGHSLFDTSSLETQILGERNGLKISYLDVNGQELSGFPSASYRNEEAYSQTVTVRVAGEESPNCYSETSFDLVVIQPPAIDLQETYYLCDQEPSRTISATPDGNSWTWFADDGTILSDSSEVVLTEEGGYTLLMGRIQNGISCESSASFRLVRTEPTIIQQLNTGEDFSGDNRIEVLASGDGELEYSIDGESYQDDNMFHELPGGTYTVYVRDKEGCGEDSRETILLDYPKFFSPNSDGINDLWKIEALADFPDAVVQIFNRYGKLLGRIRPGDIGWDGTFKGNPLPSSDYWFTLNLGDGREYKKHFALKR
ncbi:T9SS type B sorting domain-containing protein [Ulvibacterium marinum]|uniref:Gliding motility-associated C-terminal domain-containing protein n=1 Tax=Ulvibacterium marinum TaxID=2419782 RepID=A0A3B0CC75_9FLAO|nr:T9SS type B sorting domain-containing protein [Ulvibacterium marinum]RKN81789.1 gliding motility-associated C-terminal domain-containing protein [Ulvibacterium marinum]